MEKHTILELKEKCDLLSWMIFNAVVKKGEVDNIWPEFPKDGKWELTLTMGGVELPILDTFKELESNLDKHIKDKAKEIVNDKFDDMFSNLEETLEGMEEEMQKHLDKFRTICEDGE